MYHTILWYVNKSKEWKIIYNIDDSKKYIFKLVEKRTIQAFISVIRTSRDCIRITGTDLRKFKVDYYSAPTAHKAAKIINKLLKEYQNMRGEAIYIGFRKQKTKAWADPNTGEVHQPKDIISHTFVQNTWTPEGEIQETGLYFNEKIEVSEDTKAIPQYTVGKIYNIQITDITKRTCKVIGEIEKDDLPF